ncbi:TPA: hypothetical protein NGQ92_004592 [Vibrio parahaemolyticus]|nr:hypothetical protein [Vibrio parahaemolyticus]HCE1338506.1 hypothetical protein [Vibrio parahaemolyticus]HCG5892854.1 hypothetical protein [Vibrio parahaemolyticus]
MVTEMRDIAVLCVTSNVDEANDFLNLGWKVLDTSSGYFFEENLEYRELEKVSTFSYSLGWFGDKADVQYPESYLARTAPF